MHDVGGISSMGSEQLSGEVRGELEHGSAERSSLVGYVPIVMVHSTAYMSSRVYLDITLLR